MAERLREYRRLKIQEEYLEKNLSGAIKCMKIDGDIIREICYDNLCALSKRQPELQEVKKTALAILKELKFLKTILFQTDYSGIKNLDTTDFKSRLTELSKAIEDFRNNGSIAKLKEKEVALDSELKEYERKAFTVHRDVAKKFNGISRGNVKTFLPRSESHDEFNELVSRTGHTQGWADDDHALFLKLRKRCVTVPKLVIELRKKREHLTKEDIVNHEAWWRVYNELGEKRKRDIVEWKIKKAEKSASNVEDNISMVIRNERDKKQSKEAMSEKKRMIEEWKAEKARKIAMDDEQNKRLEGIKKQEEKKRIRIIKQRLRDKQQRRDEESVSTTNPKSQLLRSSNPSKQLQRADSMRLIKSFREQDQRFIMKRKVKTTPCIVSEIEKSGNNRPKQLRGGASTLLTPTKVWEQKSRRKTEELSQGIKDPFNSVNYVKDIPKLGTSSSFESNRSCSTLRFEDPN